MRAARIYLGIPRRGIDMPGASWGGSRLDGGQYFELLIWRRSGRLRASAQYLKVVIAINRLAPQTISFVP